MKKLNPMDVFNDDSFDLLNGYTDMINESISSEDGLSDFLLEANKLDIADELDGKNLKLDMKGEIDKDHPKTVKAKTKTQDTTIEAKKQADGDLEFNLKTDVDIHQKEQDLIKYYNDKLPQDIKTAKAAGIPANYAETIFAGVMDIVNAHLGALITFQKEDDISEYCKNGHPINCPVSKEIFMTIFYTGTEVHDGAVVIQDGIIKYASVFYKNIEGKKTDKHAGARHRAAMGISAATDSISIVVSEEKGTISFAVNGDLLECEPKNFISWFNKYIGSPSSGSQESQEEHLTLKQKLGLTEGFLFDHKTDKAFKAAKKDATDAVIDSRARHLADNKAKDPETPANEVGEYKYIAKKLARSKTENLARLVQDADETNDRVSVDIRDDNRFAKNTNSVTADFEGKTHMSLHVIKGENPILDKERQGRQQSTGYGENDTFIKDVTGKDIKELAKDKFEAEKKDIGLTESIEFTFDVNASPEDIDSISDVMDQIKDIAYGFISKKDGTRIDDREWIHGCRNLSDYYETNWNPFITLKNKLGICLDQSIAIQYLFKKYYPECPCTIYALTKGRFGHAVPTYEKDGKYFYLENAWDKEKGLHGPFNNKEDLENYLSYVYHKNHDKDNDDPVNVQTYDDFAKQNLNESVKLKIDLK